MLNRLLAIVYTLMKTETVKASEFAKRFEVSVRTIYRDVENLSMAGIPIYMKKGKNGGISLTEQFVLNKMLVTEQEQEQILAAMVSLDEVGALGAQETLKKLGTFFHMDPPPWVSVDLSDWSGSRQEMFQQIKEAILNKRVLSFYYYGQNAAGERTVEPVQLVFKEYTWYLRAYCREKEDMRMFKLLRIKRLVTKEELFFGTHEEEQKPVGEQKPFDMVRVVMHIDASEAYRVYDRFEEEEVCVLEDGSFRITMNCLLDNWVFGLIFSFGPAAEVLEPNWLRREMTDSLCRMLKRYESH